MTDTEIILYRMQQQLDTIYIRVTITWIIASVVGGAVVGTLVGKLAGA